MRALERGHLNWRLVQQPYAPLPDAWHPAIQVVDFEDEVIDHAGIATSAAIGDELEAVGGGILIRLADAVRAIL